ncbi:MAG: MAPEG family protein [Pseudooceanicola sp.]
MEFAPLALAALLGIVHIVLAAQAANQIRGLRYAIGPRDETIAPLDGVAARLRRAQTNFLETFPIFAALFLAATLLDVSDWRMVWGPWLYLGARVVYVPLYAFGVTLWRTLAWNAASVGQLLILWAVLWP